MPETTTTTAIGSVESPDKATETALAGARSYLERFAKETVEQSVWKDPVEAGSPEVAETETETEEGREITPDPNKKEESEEVPATEDESEETTEAETPEESPEEEGEEGDEGEVAGITPEIQESINRRIGKEVAKTKAEREAKTALEQKLQELTAQYEQLKTAPPEQRVVKANGPLADVTDLKVLSQKRAEALEVKEQVTELLENVEDDPGAVEAALRQARITVRDESGQEDYSVGRMRKTLRQIDRNIRKTLDEIPHRENHLKTEAEILTKLHTEIMPELKDPTSQRSKIWNQLKSDFPEAMLNPKWPVLLMMSTAYLEAMKNTPTSPNPKPAPVVKPKTPPVKIPAKPKSAPPPTKAKEAQMAALKEQMVSGKTPEAQREARVALLQNMLAEQG